MRTLAICLLALALSLPVSVIADEGDPLLSVDDLLSLENSYEAFLSELETLIVERGLLSEEEREIWHDAQMGDFFQNGGYGSILASYTPGILGYIREEDTLLTLRAQLSGGQTLEVSTMRRYTPQDSSLSGLMLTVSLIGADGMPQDAAFSMSAPSGVFLKWDAMTGAYVSVGTSAESAGETVVFSDQTPMPDANNPMITIDVLDAQTGEAIGCAELTLTVDGEGYLIADDALIGK